MNPPERASNGGILKPHEQAGLHKYLEVSFRLDELKSLAFELGADYGLYVQSKQDALAFDLVRYCERREQLGLLIAKMMQQQPKDPFLTLLQAKLPPSLPRARAQIVLAHEHGSHLNGREMASALAEFFDLPQDQIDVMGLADVGKNNLRLLVSLPRGTVCPQVRLGSHKLCNAKYEVFFVTALDELEQASQQAWRRIATNHPPRQRSMALLPAISWEKMARADGIDGTSLPSLSRTPESRQPRSQFLPRIPRAALWIVFFVALYIAVVGILAIQNENKRSQIATQVELVKKTTTAIALETIDTQRSIAETATAVATLQFTPAMPTPAPTWTLTLASTGAPTSTPTRSLRSTPTQPSTPTAPSASIPTHTATPTVPPTSTPTHTPSPTASPTNTPTRTPPPTMPPTNTPAHTPAPTTTTTPPMSVPAEVPMALQPGDCVALRSASVYDRPGVIAEIEELGVIARGGNVTRVGLALPPWDTWIKVRRPSDSLEGFAWGPRFECQPGPPWPELEIVQLLLNWHCDEHGTKYAGLIVVVQGGDGLYTFAWEGQEVAASELEQPGEYLVRWPWGTAPSAGRLMVTSGDGQSVVSDALFMQKPSCSQ